MRLRSRAFIALVVVSCGLIQYSAAERIASKTTSALRRKKKGTPVELRSYENKHCRDMIDTGTPLGNVRCCSEAKVGFIPPTGVQCLPMMIIAGAQKTGTTVLSAILAQHPNINFALKKELHHFDNTEKYNRGVKTYVSSFPPLYLDNGPRTGYKKTFTEEHLIPQGSSGWFDNINGKKTGKIVNASMVSAKKIVPLNAESTPFYIASDTACERIARTIPNVRLILLLREPVARAYSEYNMKKRRVENQNLFLSAMNGPMGLAEVVRDCCSVFEYEGKPVDTEKLDNCMLNKASVQTDPTVADKIRSLVGMVSWTKTMKLLTRISVKKKTWFRECFRRTKPRQTRRLGDDHWDLSDIRDVESSPRHGNRSGLDISISALQGWKPMEAVRLAPAHFHDSPSHSFEHKSDRYTPTVTESEWAHIDLRSYSSRRQLLQRMETNISLSIRPSYGFDFNRCLDRNRESIGPIDLFVNEKTTFESCAKDKLPNRKLVTAYDYLDAVTACVKIARCSKHIPLQRMLFINNEEMKNNITAAMKKVTKFLHIPLHFDSATLERLASDETIVEKLFPSMITSGWEQASKYDPLPAATSKILKDFFTPMNEALFSLIDERYTHW